MNIFTLRNITYGYDPENPILKNLSFDIKKGKKTAIVGANGAGKSTILFHLNGLYTANSGEIAFNGQIVNRRNQKEMVRNVGVVFQDPDDQILSLTVREDIEFGPSQMGFNSEAVKQKVDKYLKLLNIEHLAERNPSELSYGQKKHVAIAGVLAMETEVFILDEPMAFLDPKGKEQMHSILQVLQTEGKTVVVASHDMQFVAEWADEVIVIHEGECLGCFTPNELFLNEDIIQKARLTFPIVFQIMKDIWKGKLAEIPIKLEDAKAWLKENL